MSNQWFPKIEGSEIANKLAKQGALGILLFSVMNLIGVLFVYYSGKSSVDQSAVGPQDIRVHVLGAVILIPLLLFFAYRVYKGKGWLVAGLVLAWFIVEVGLKVAGGTTNIGWMFLYAGVAAMIFNGLRACWWLRRGAPRVTEESPGIQ